MGVVEQFKTLVGSDWTNCDLANTDTSDDSHKACEKKITPGQFTALQGWATGYLKDKNVVQFKGFASGIKKAEYEGIKKSAFECVDHLKPNILQIDGDPSEVSNVAGELKDFTTVVRDYLSPVGHESVNIFTGKDRDTVRSLKQWAVTEKFGFDDPLKNRVIPYVISKDALKITFKDFWGVDWFDAKDSATHTRSTILSPFNNKLKPSAKDVTQADLGNAFAPFGKYVEKLGETDPAPFIDFFAFENSVKGKMNHDVVKGKAKASGVVVVGGGQSTLFELVRTYLGNDVSVDIKKNVCVVQVTREESRTFTKADGAADYTNPTAKDGDKFKSADPILTTYKGWDDKSLDAHNDPDNKHPDAPAGNEKKPCCKGCKCNKK